MNTENWNILGKFGVTCDNLSVGGSLFLEGTDITSLPDGLSVGGSLYLEGTGISSLPANLSVGGDLYLHSTGITSLPDGLSVDGSLDLRGTGITSLPDGLSVGDSLYLRGTGITSLPENLSVGGHLDLEDTCITGLPKNLSVGGHLDLEGTGITSLPDNLSVGGALYLEGTGITSLPDGLSIGGALDLRGTGITSLPDNLKSKRIFWDHTGPFAFRGKDYEVSLIDGYSMILGEWKTQNGLSVCAARYLYGCAFEDMPKCFIAKQDEHYAHGDTLRQAVDDLRFKILSIDLDVDDLVHEIRDRDSMTIPEYRALTGACASGINEFLKDRGIDPERGSLPLSEVLEITRGTYGGDRMRKLFT